jgi:RHS repeat-associated protein
VAINGYDAWGIPNAANQGRFGYTGQAWLPELGMWYYKARIYSPTLGRFMQTDPVGYSGGINLYLYVGDDPLNNSDPAGTVCIPVLNSGSEFCQRANVYEVWARSPALGGKTDFFAAAASVSRALANVDLPFAGLRVDNKTREFLSATGRALAAANSSRAQAMMNGQIYGGVSRSAIDRDWVRFEQQRVQLRLDSLSTGDRKSVVSNVNSVMNGTNPVPGDGDFREALSKTRQQLGRDFDFGRMGDRVRLGDNLNDIYRSRQTCTGSRIPGAGCN